MEVLRPGRVTAASAGPPPVAHTVAAAALSTVLGALPVFLLSGLAVLVRQDVALGELQLGLAVSTFFAVAAVSAVPAGRAVERLGARRATGAAALGSALALATMAAAHSYPVLLAGLALAGVANALAQIASNEALARVVPRARQGFAFGVKQAAVPAATVLAGLSLPLLGLTLGWRAAFVGAASSAVAYAAVVRRGIPAGRAAPAGRSRPSGSAPRGPLAVLAVAAGLGAGAAGALSAFLVVSAVGAGVPPARAGLLLAAGSMLSVFVRLIVGRRADAREGGHLQDVAAMLAVGSLGMGLLATGSTVLLLPGAVVAFALGWGWPGLLNFAVVRLHPAAPAAATSITQAGVFAGGALGPLAFGVLVVTWSYAAAWSVAGVALVTAAVLMRLGRGLLATAQPG